MTDIICKSDAAEGFNEDKKHSLHLIIGRNITKPNSKHNGCAPIITPNISNEPMCFTNIDFRVPRLLWVDSGHKI